MATDKPTSRWTPVVVVLSVMVIATGSIIILSKHSSGQPLEIFLAPQPEIRGTIYIGGTVNNPGFYPLMDGDSIQDVVLIAGGTADDADLSQLRLYVPNLREAEQPQKVNLNRAELWLLQALPGIGETRAQAIIDYRRQNGRFENINELIKIEGIGTATFERIKDLVTVGD